MNVRDGTGKSAFVPSRRSLLIAMTIGPGLFVATSRAQPGKKIVRVAIVDNMPRSSPDNQPRYGYRGWRGFDQAMRERGWVEGENIIFERRYFQGDLSRLPDLMAELVALDVDAILTVTAPATLAAKKATDRIPIVFSVGDAVGRGIVASLAQPGGNATGTSGQFVEIQAKRVELLQQLSPRIARVAVLMYTTLGFPPMMFREPPLRGVDIAIVELRGADDLDRALATVSKLRADGVLLAQLWSDARFRAEIVEAVARTRLPAIFPTREYVQLGGLLSYGTDIGPTLAQTAVYIDKILRGAKPADLPIEQPTAFDLAINLKTARGLGISVPRELLVRADLVIE